MPWLIDEPGQRVPVLVWARALPRETQAQLSAIASQPYVRMHVAAMPDAHVAHGVAVGTVFVTDDTVVPGALGGDLGCGVCAVPFDVEAAALDRRMLERLVQGLGRVVPVGDEVHPARAAPTLPDALRAPPLSTSALEHMRERVAPRHLGTLGGGNHFLELDRGADGSLWLLVHSGSRGAGGAVYQHHVAAAGGGLAGLGVDSAAGRAYLDDTAWALAFARANRDAIRARAAEVISELVGAVAGEPVDVHHNYVAREEHGGASVFVHRKGATVAPQGALGIVPGSMGTASYLVRGRGAPSSFASAAHGAGRVMSRADARRSIRPRTLEAELRRVVYGARRVASLVEEAPSAYRDIGEVMEDQADLVEPVLRLEPLAVLKG